MLRKSWNRAVVLAATVVASLTVAVAGAAAWDITCAISKNTLRNGRIYVSVIDKSGTTVAAASAAPEASSITLKEIPDGSGYTLHAFVDTQGLGIQHANDPEYTSQSFSVSSDITNASAVLADPVPVAAAPISQPSVTPLDKSAAISWTVSKDAFGHEIADTYNIYWSTGNNPGPGSTDGGGQLFGFPATGADSVVIYSLSDGAPLSFAIYPVISNDVQSFASSPVSAPTTINPPEGFASTSRLSGTVADGSNAAPLDQVTVQLTEAPSASVITGADGKYSVTAPSTSSFSVHLSKEGYVPLFSSLMSQATDDVINWKMYTEDELTGIGILPQPGKGVMCAEIADVSSNPPTAVSGAEITVRSMLHPEAPYQIRYTNGTPPIAPDAAATAADGRFYVLDIDDGDYVTVNAAKQGMSFTPQTVVPRRGAVSSTVLRGRKNQTVSPKVTRLVASPSATVLQTTSGGDPLAVPTASPAEGTYTSTQNITLTQSASAPIYYTTNGADPTLSGVPYSAPITVNKSTTIKFYASSGGVVSAPGTATYRISPISFSGTVREYGSNQPVAGATVELVGAPSIFTTTDSSGNFILVGPTSGQNFTLKITATGKQPTYTSIQNSTGNISDRSFVLFTAADLWSSFTITPGLGMVQGTVEVYTPDGKTAVIDRFVVSSDSQFTTYGNTRGVFYVKNMQPDTTVEITASWRDASFDPSSFPVFADAVTEGGIFGHDPTPPTVTLFTPPDIAIINQSIAIGSYFQADDNIGVTGYLVTEDSADPSWDDPRWGTSPPATYGPFSSLGTKTLYAWVKDAAGNISAKVWAEVSVLSSLLAPTTTTVAPTSPSIHNSPANFTATVTSSTPGTISGSVQFFDGATAISGLIPLADGTASFTIATLSVGDHSITARYGGSDSYETSTSNPITHTVTKAPQTVTFNPLPQKTYGDADFSAGATAGSGLAVSYASSNPAVASIVGGQIHIVGAGTTTITASQAGDATFDPAVAVAQTLTVNKASLTVTVENKTKTYGQANPGLTVTYSGFVNNETAASLITTPLAATTAMTGSPAGNYPITVNGAVSDNYSFSYVAGTLTVNPAPLTVTADNKSKPFGAVNPPLTISYSGFVNGDTAASLTTQPIATTTATTDSPVGAYPITVSGGVSSNYTFNYVAGTLSVGQQSQAITFNALAQKTYGDADFAPGATASSGLTVSYASSNPAIATVVGGQIHIVGAGTTTITASQAGDGTFEPAANVVQNLTVNKASLTVTADSKTKLYGQANPALTVTYSGFVNGETAANLTTQPIAATTATTGSPVGAYPITVSGGVSPNYSFTYVAGTLSVGQQSQTITFNALAPKTYGDADFAPGATASSGLTVSYASSNPAVATVVGGQIHIVGAGTTTITSSQAGNGSFEPAANVAQSLTVNKATLTVTADNKTKAYAQVNPALTITYSGFVNGDTAASLTTQPIASATATTDSPVGAYPITVSGGVSPNYNFAYVAGTLTITSNEKAVATVTLTSSTLTQTYDGTQKPAAATTVPSGLAVTFTYNGSSEPPISAGTYTVVATVTDANFQGSASGILTINKATPALSWTRPADVTYGTLLSGIQLNASTTVPGTYVFSPSLGSKLNPGTQTLSVTFNPSDQANFTTATATTTLNVINPTGDINNDGKVDLADAITALKLSVGVPPEQLGLDSSYILRGDVAPFKPETGKSTPDGSIDTGDAIVILRRVVNLITF